MSRFHIPSGAELRQDAFLSFEAFIRLLEASADDLRCPDFGLRLSSWQGLDILGPLAVIARNAQTVLERCGGDRALPLHPLARIETDSSGEPSAASSSPTR